MRYIKTPEVFVEAEQWFKNGDHSKDECEVINHGTPEEYLSEGKFVRRFRHPDPEFSGEKICDYCKNPYHQHGWIDIASIGAAVSYSKRELMVCPGDYIVTIDEGAGYQIRSAHSFERGHTQYPELSPVEALYGFASWLTIRKQPVTFSEKHNSAPAGQLVSRFAQVQKLGTPREEVWPDNLIPMSQYDLPVGDTNGGPTPFFNEVVKLLQMAADLVGNPGTGISSSTDIACASFQSKLRAFAANNNIKITTYSSAQTGEELIKEERSRQIEEEGFTEDHDDQYQNGELATAADCYVNAAMDKNHILIPDVWPWDEEWWKPTTKLANLIKAGALYLAEYERVKRAFGNYKPGLLSIVQMNIDQVVKLIDEELKSPKQ